MSLLARLLGMLVAFVAVVAAAPAAAATWYVAGNGLDAPDCGTKRKPCRSITRALAQPTTVDGDRIIVGPGRYGDANDDGNLDDPGDEMPAPGCGCMLAVNKSVSVWSSNGAAATVIDAAGMPVRATVALFMNGGEFGRLGKGFTITSSADLSPIGISIDSGNIAVRGNQVIGYDRPFGTGIATVAFPQPIAT